MISKVRRLRAVALAVLFSALASHAADETLEFAVKATYLLKFTKFIQWPPALQGPGDAPFTICVFGSNPFGNSLNQVVAGETVAGHRIVIQRLEHEDPLSGCRVLYFGDHEERPRLSGEATRGILTVGEGSAFVRNGGMIGFVIDSRRVTFDINWKAAEASGLKLSSGLLSVAKSVIR